MAYTPTEWKDHILSDDNYKITQNSDGTSSIKPSGSVVQQGTPMSADNFNHMEQGIKSAADTADSAKTRCEEVLTESNNYTDDEISKLINGAPEDLDTLRELAAAFQSASDLITALQKYSVKKKVIYCPELTPTDGVCTWMINHGITTETEDIKAGQIIIQIYDISGNQISCNVTNVVPSSVSVAKFSSTSTITANSYYAVCIG